jgi:phenylalanyl-tRNA synthetase alpha chain
MTLSERLQELSSEAAHTIEAAKDAAALETAEIRYLGRKGLLPSLLKEMASASAEERPALGRQANEIKTLLEGKLAATKERLNAKSVESKLREELEDVTEPGIRPTLGHRHIVNHAMREIAAIFERAGFARFRAPEVEWDWYTFEALNMPKEHPARDEWETFFMDAEPSAKWGRMVLTPHATSGTARLLAKKELPLRAITMTKTYRRQIGVRHLPMFHQFDGVFVDQNVSVTHLLGILEYFVHEFFGKDRKVRLRPYHFRFTEPSFEIDISCGVCGGTGMVEYQITNNEYRTDGGDRAAIATRNSLLATRQKCRLCKHGWLELGGAGMLHPNVLTAAGIDPKKFSGLAFGWGVERTYMMKEGIQLDDIRELYKNDLRFLQQF